MLAELSVFPLDKGAEGLSRYVAGSIKIIEDSGLDYEMHALGTLIEGPTDKVFEVIRKCHENMAAQSDRVVTYVKIDDRKGREGAIKKKVESVREKLGEANETPPVRR
ncbi:MAG: MTH1187 family thiamine-binding protein [Pseudomonadota bacterium]